MEPQKVNKDPKDLCIASIAFYFFLLLGGGMTAWVWWALHQPHQPYGAMLLIGMICGPIFVLIAVWGTPYAAWRARQEIKRLEEEQRVYNLITWDVFRMVREHVEDPKTKRARAWAIDLLTLYSRLLDPEIETQLGSEVKRLTNFSCVKRVVDAPKK